MTRPLAPPLPSPQLAAHVAQWNAQGSSDQSALVGGELHAEQSLLAPGALPASLMQWLVDVSEVGAAAGRGWEQQKPSRRAARHAAGRRVGRRAGGGHSSGRLPCAVHDASSHSAPHFGFASGGVN